MIIQVVLAPFFIVFVEWWSSQVPPKGFTVEGGKLTLRVTWASLVESLLESFLRAEHFLSSAWLFPYFWLAFPSCT
jgi:hypothetical protein